MHSTVDPLYRRIAIIGGGPCGLAIAKALSLEPIKFDSIVLFEGRDKLGGVWNYTKGDNHFRPVSSPSTRTSHDIYSPNDAFSSAMYADLETNIVSRLMEFKDFHFSNHKSYQTRQEVLKYLQDYATTIPSSVEKRLNTVVKKVSKDHNEWHVEYVNPSKDSRTNTSYFDAIVIANGHFNVPFIPDINGLRHWYLKDPGSITHAKNYVRDTDFSNKNVLVVGFKSSGSDIAIQVSVSAKNVFVSSRQKEPLKNQKDRFIGIITKYDLENNRSVETEDGEVLNNIDCVIFCTGYLYDLPFLKSYTSIIDDGKRIKDLYKQVFYIPDPSLSFAGIPKDVIPMPLAESQGAIIGRVYTGRLKLPSQEAMWQSYQREVSEKGEGFNFHRMGYPKDGEYCQELQRIIDDANLRDGFVASLWDDDKMHLRSQTADMKKQRMSEVITFANNLKKKGENFRLLE